MLIVTPNVNNVMYTYVSIRSAATPNMDVSIIMLPKSYVDVANPGTLGRLFKFSTNVKKFVFSQLFLYCNNNWRPSISIKQRQSEENSFLTLSAAVRKCRQSHTDVQPRFAGRCGRKLSTQTEQTARSQTAVPVFATCARKPEYVKGQVQQMVQIQS